MSDSGTKIMIPAPTASSLINAPVPPPPIVHSLLVEQHPVAVEKNKSIHSEHGVIHYPFYFGGLASAVTSCCTQPLGVGKLVAGVRLQTQTNVGQGMVMTQIFRTIWREEGLTASLARTLTYSTVRFALYEKLKENSTTPTHAPSGAALAGMAASSGFIGSIAGNFADVVCLRMQNDMSLPPEQRRNYRNVVHGLSTMIRHEGWASIWTGVWVGAGRAAIATATQLAGYDVFKRELMARTSLTDSVPTHITASCLAGFLSTFICSPWDVFKARWMTMKGTTHPMLLVLARTFRNEGMGWMFKGLTPALISRAPSTIITFVTFEQLKRAYRHYHDLEE
ncbi:mitochondrial carrier domain-containing protein [Elsinoe ampelina]|uniref:Mitochondrial carrier domain-containing protein n=1 Tax=Elsinoe ampelina TaxID=302913 RepID=A0A6A6G5L5_9PEZI|nr:mitochondrial carrier domain-containing protein [Elsinoe ampelina]